MLELAATLLRTFFIIGLGAASNLSGYLDGAAAAGIGVIDTRTPLEADWRQAFGRGGASPQGDGVHPPPEGMRLIADAVWKKARRPLAPGPNAASLTCARRPRHGSSTPTTGGRSRQRRAPHDAFKATGC